MSETTPAAAQLEEAPERKRLAREAQAWQQAELAGDAAVIQRALARVLDEHQPGAAAELKAHAANTLANHEREHGTIVLTPVVRKQVERASELDIPPFPSAIAEPVITLAQRGKGGANETGTPLAPAHPLAGYVIKDVPNGHEYYQINDGQLALRTDAQRIQGVLSDARTINATLDLAVARGWSELEINGSPDVVRRTWIEATARGINTTGHIPTFEDRLAVEQRRLEREQGIELPGNPALADPPAVTPNLERAPPPPPTRAAKEPWMTRTDGLDGLSPQMQASAVRSYERWVARNPEKNVGSLEDYVSYVQSQDAERRQTIPPPKVGVPRRGMRL